MGPKGPLPFTFASCVLLSGCGQYLGDYSLEKVAGERELPSSFPKDAQSYGRFVAITLASRTSLTAIGDKLDGVYVDADFCPLKDPHRLVALGPVSEDGSDLSLPSAAAKLKPQADGRFRYRIYLVAAHPVPGVQYSKTAMEWPRYDLLSANRDVCVRLFAPGYNLTPSKSQTVTIPAKLIAAALANSDGVRHASRQIAG
jgi:hypothetical protein